MLVKVYDILLFFRDYGSASSRATHSSDEEVVRDDIELLLVVARGVGRAGEASQVDESRTSDVVGN